MAIPILKAWENYFIDRDEGLGSSYERVILNNKLEHICKEFQINNLLEIPVFGFTGLSGINSLHAAIKGQEVTIADNNEKRIDLIKSVWHETGKEADVHMVGNFSPLPFPDKKFDMSWNFSALWFVDNLSDFLKELVRVTKKVIFICVPNISAIGYISQKYLGKEDLKKYLKEENIFSHNIKKSMADFGWKLTDSNYIDCPPWPDIGMAKKKFLSIFCLGWLVKEKKDNLSIMDYYTGKDPAFPEKMMKYYFFEKYAPRFIKKLWAHHRYFLYIPSTSSL